MNNDDYEMNYAKQDSKSFVVANKMDMTLQTPTSAAEASNMIHEFNTDEKYDRQNKIDKITSCSKTWKSRN